ncbi:MAG: hypothetical protein ACE5IQ_03565 [Candidatus Methylomirabilales bacterium]
MWIKLSADRSCANCDISTERWVLYGHTGRVVVEATFCPICYPALTRIFEKTEAPRYQDEPPYPLPLLATERSTELNMARSVMR